MEGNDHTKTTPDIEDTNRARPMKRNVKLYLGNSYNIQQSNQNNLDPNTKRFKRILIYYNMDTQYAHFQ